MNPIAAHSPRPAPTVCFEDVMLPATELHDAPAARYTLCLVLQGEARLSYRVDDRWHTQWLHPGMFAPITPPHVDATLQLSGEQRHLMISIDEETVVRVAGESGSEEHELDTLRLRAFKDPFLAELCRRAWAEARRGDALGRSFAESIEGTLICGLLRSASGTRRLAKPPVRGKLSEATLARIHDHCLARLHEPIAIADLAAVAGLGPHQFGKAFKAASARSPQQYLIALRTQRAQELLRGSKLSIADIALQCGFFDQSHLTTTFTRCVGVPPHRYRHPMRHQ